MLVVNGNAKILPYAAASGDLFALVAIAVTAAGKMTSNHGKTRGHLEAAYTPVPRAVGYAQALQTAHILGLDALRALQAERGFVSVRTFGKLS